MYLNFDIGGTVPPSMDSSDDLLSTAGGMSSEQIGDRLDELFREKAAVEGAIVVLLGEVELRRTHLRRPVAPDHDVAPVATVDRRSGRPD